MPLIENLTVSVIKKWVQWKSKKQLPQISGNISVKGLSKDVEIIRDKWGVSHIYAKNLDDLAFAQGYVHAQDRLWQMEMNRRIARGTLSEIAGDITLDTDRASRTLGFERLAKNDIPNINPEIKKYLNDYLRGVNTFIEQNLKRLPPEYALLKFAPRPWEELDVMSFSRMLAWQLCYAWFGEIVRANIIDKVGAEKAAELEIHYPSGNPATLEKLGEVNVISDDGRLNAMKGPFLQPLGGSNSWAISGSRTESGKPLLCNDPHMPMLQPALWYENHLCAPGIEVTGVTLPGVPLVMIGHNIYIAWGMTLAFTDIQDLYVEKFTNELCTHYIYNGAEKKSSIINEAIKVKGKPDYIEKVIITRHGPVISKITGQENQHLALHSKALEKLDILNAWFELNMAKNWNDFVKAMRHINAPALNVTYADTAGNIGYWVTGEIPIRKNGISPTPVPGWTDENEWVGKIPFEEMPHAFNPEKGFVITCNHKIVSDDYPYDLGNAWMNGYRAKRFEMIMKEKNLTDIHDMKKMQSDIICLPAFEFIQHYKTLQIDDPQLSSARDTLVNWDGALQESSAAAALYQLSKFFMLEKIIGKKLGDALMNKFRGATFNDNLLPQGEFYGYDTVTLLRLLKNENSWWIKEAGGKHHILLEALKSTVSHLENKFGKDTNKWRWGNMHQVAFNHSLGLKKPMDKVFNQGPFPVPGDTDTIFQTATYASDPQGYHVIAPSYRQIIDTGDWSNSLSVIAPGQSGNMASPHYNDQLSLWLKGEYHPMLWTRDDVEKYQVNKLKLSVDSSG